MWNLEDFTVEKALDWDKGVLDEKNADKAKPGLHSKY